LSKMLDRVAETLMRTIHRNPELTLFGQAEDIKENWRILARSAIEAMREPTGEMYNAIYRTGANAGQFPNRDIWQAMIDEALK